MLNHNNMPGAGSIADTVEFMRKMWNNVGGNMGASVMGIPSLSVEEIDRKIADLKTVASWLELNMNMLRATIQTLEVQSATLSALQAMGAILTPGAADDAKAGAASPSSFPTWPPQSSTRDKEAVAPQPEPESESEPDEAPEGKHPQAAMPAPDFQASIANPNVWWNLLQQQFQQAVGKVLADQVPAEKTASPAKVATPKKADKPKAQAKPRTRAKLAVVQSRPSKPAARKPKSP